MTGYNDVLMAEYTALKAEQLARIGTRDNLLYATLAAFGAVLAAALTSGQPTCLLMVPPAAVILGWTYLANDLKISAIREYIRTELARRMDALSGGTGADPLPFGWEFAHLVDPLYASRRAAHLGVDLLAFVLTPAAVIIVCLVAYRGPALTTAAVFAVAVAEAGAVGSLGLWITGCYSRAGGA